jgi:hypothetical protein
MSSISRFVEALPPEIRAYRAILDSKERRASNLFAAISGRRVSAIVARHNRPTPGPISGAPDEAGAIQPPQLRPR